MIDYRALLSKYISHVGQEEGTTFLFDRPPSSYNDVEFTDEEWAELQLLEGEL